MTNSPRLNDVFAKRARLMNDRAPVFAALCRAVAADPALAAPVADAARTPSKDDPGHGPIWGLPHRFFGLVTRLLRTEARGHELAGYWATLGGRRGVDAALDACFADFVNRYRRQLTELAARYPQSRQNDAFTAALLWPGLAWAASRVSGRVALIELGSAAGMCLYADRYGYRYGGKRFGGDGPPVFDVDGELAADLGADMDVAARIGLEYEPIRDGRELEWLRDCVFPDHATQLSELDAALSTMEPDGVDWRRGDFMDTLPALLAELPGDVTPIVFGSHSLCCVDRRHRLPETLAAARRDVAWVAKEFPDVALELVSAAAADYLPDEGERSPVLLTVAQYRAGALADVQVLAEVDELERRLLWTPRAAPVRPGT